MMMRLHLQCVPIVRKPNNGKWELFKCSGLPTCGPIDDLESALGYYFARPDGRPIEVRPQRKTKHNLLRGTGTIFSGGMLTAIYCAETS